MSTHSPVDDVASLLSPDKLIPPDDLLDVLTARSLSRGVYGWWFDQSLPLVPRDGCVEREGKHLLYLGTAPQRDSAARTLRDRLHDNHIRGTVRRSTLRHSLAALLQQPLDLKFWRDARNRVNMDPEPEARLSDWLRHHAAVSITPHDAPWTLEHDLIRNGPPLPLNIQGSGHPFAATLSHLRCALAPT